jgi:VanZ family protein
MSGMLELHGLFAYRHRHWIAPIAWMALIVWFSSDAWSADRTGGAFAPLASWLLPWATPADAEAVHIGIRKLAHLAEYAILAWLWARALGVGTTLPARSAAAIAIGISVAWAALDETRQSMVPSRTGSPGDVLIDSAGAVLGLSVYRLDWRTAVARATTVLLWVAAAGGAAVLTLDWVTGAESRAAWLTTPLAALGLALRRRLRPRSGEPPRSRRGARASHDDRSSSRLRPWR